MTKPLVDLKPKQREPLNRKQRTILVHMLAGLLIVIGLATTLVGLHEGLWLALIGAGASGALAFGTSGKE